MTKNAPFFGGAERREALIAELRSWTGTRFRRESGGRAKKGVYADCVSFVEAVLVNLGAIHPVAWPPYLNCGGGAAMRELLLKTMDDIPEMGRIWWRECGTPYRELAAQNKLIPGDVFFRSIGDDCHHLGIYGGDLTLWNCRARQGVGTASVMDTYGLQDLQVIYRVFEKA